MTNRKFYNYYYYTQKDKSKYNKENRSINEYYYCNKHICKSKNKNFRKNNKIDFPEKNIAETESGILDKKELQNYVDSLLPFSFALRTEFELTNNYYSADEEEFYLINNPILKDKVYKFPLVRGSSWKGNFVHTAFEIIQEEVEDSEDIGNFLKNFFSFTRLFGSCSNDFRDLEKEIKKFIDKHKDSDTMNILKELVNYALFEMGIKLKLNTEKDKIKQVFNQVKDELKEIKTQKGRLISYPTFFDKIALKVINKHSRKTKAGESPIFYEVVPKGTNGILQLIYIPFNSLWKTDEEIKEKVESDLKFLAKIVRKTIEEKGIGAKQKLGWGKGKIDISEVFMKKQYHNLISLEADKCKFYEEENDV